jgi:hypothetical protein
MIGEPFYHTIKVMVYKRIHKDVGASVEEAQLCKDTRILVCISLAFLKTASNNP